MTAIEYKHLRKQLGSQQEVARLLQVNDNTISRREASKQPINEEAALAILHLVEMRKLPARQSQQRVETRPREKTTQGKAETPSLWKDKWK